MSFFVEENRFNRIFFTIMDFKDFLKVVSRALELKITLSKYFTETFNSIITNEKAIKTMLENLKNNLEQIYVELDRNLKETGFYIHVVFAGTNIYYKILNLHHEVPKDTSVALTKMTLTGEIYLSSGGLFIEKFRDLLAELKEKGSNEVTKLTTRLILESTYLIIPADEKIIDNLWQIADKSGVKIGILIRFIMGEILKKIEKEN